MTSRPTQGQGLHCATPTLGPGKVQSAAPGSLGNAMGLRLTRTPSLLGRLAHPSERVSSSVRHSAIPESYPSRRSPPHPDQRPRRGRPRRRRQRKRRPCCIETLSGAHTPPRPLAPSRRQPSRNAEEPPQSGDPSLREPPEAAPSPHRPRSRTPRGATVCNCPQPGAPIRRAPERRNRPDANTNKHSTAN